jgi:spermidine synthase
MRASSPRADADRRQVATAVLLAALVSTLLGGLLVGRRAVAEVVFTKRSLYRNLSVADDGDELCLQFESARQAALWQSCIDKKNPDRLVFDYTQMTFAGLALQPHPKRILVAGLGGGSIPRVWLRLFPEAQIDVIEIDPAVVEVAYQYFEFPKAKNLRVFEKDARVFVKGALRDGARYDYVVLDAFTGDYIPEHLMTREFLAECKGLLAPGGVLVANTFTRSKLYDSESRTYEAAFGWFLNIKRGSTNRIVLVHDGPPVARSAYIAYVDAFYDASGQPKATLDPAVRAALTALPGFGVDLRAIATMAAERPDWKTDAKILTDQYAPANLLNQP